ncbi:MAG: N-(5'-phosphoribosyl)anthranilate isomerase [Runella sp.]
MISTLVKVSPITHLSDARYCAGMGVEMLGFSIDENTENFIDLPKFQEIKAWITGVKIVVESSQSDAGKLLEQIRQYQPDIVQISDASFLPWLKSEIEQPIILSVEANQDADTIEEILGQNAAYISYFLLQSKEDVALSGDWPDFLASLAERFPILLGFGISPDNVLECVSRYSLAGIALKGTQELRPGYSDFDTLMEVLEALEDD